MAAKNIKDAGAAETYQPYVPATNSTMPELTWSAVLVGSILGIIFGASSLYLVLRVGITVSASIPVAVLSITLFRVFSRVFGIRRTTILENNIVQTTGSAGESIAFGVGVTIPALMLLGFEMELTRVMMVGLFGGLLGILMMIPLRRAFVVRQHGKLTYPEGTACADVLIVGEQGGATAKTVFAGFGLGLVYKFLMSAGHLWKEAPEQALYTQSGGGLRGGVIGGDFAPELLGVGYIIGPRVSSIMLGGGVLAYLVLVPTIVLFSTGQAEPLAPASKMIADMSVGEIRNQYVLYIGAGAVAAGGLISLLQALPLIGGSILAGLRDLRASRTAGSAAASVPRTDRDLPLWFVVVGCLGLVIGLAAVPSLGLGLTLQGALAAALIVLFGFLFVTVSSRLTGEIGSSSNPISGMTVATLLFTCLVFLLLNRTTKSDTLTALTIAAIVCIASSNGGTTAQDLKTGFLVGATPKSQQIAIFIGAMTSALVIGGTLLLLNSAGTVYSRNQAYLPQVRMADATQFTQREQPGGEYKSQDQTAYRVVHAAEGEFEGVPQGKYLIDDEGYFRYLVDPAINGRLRQRDDGTEVTTKFDAPKTRLMGIIIDGILNRKLPWGLVMIGILIAVTLELAGVASLPFAVGVYLPIQVSVPIFIGGGMRYLADRLSQRKAEEAEMSPGVLLSSGYIAGGAIGGVIIAFFAFAPKNWVDLLDLSKHLPAWWNDSNWPSVVVFGGLAVLLLLVGWGKLLAGEPAPVHPKSEKPPSR